jgi:hypothetical protein
MSVAGRRRAGRRAGRPVPPALGRPNAGATPAAARRRIRVPPAATGPAATAVALAAIVLGSLLLRSTALHARYWIDEGLSVGIAQHELADIPGLLVQDGSPPLYYLLLSVWIDIAGFGEADTHVLSLALVLLTVPVAFAAARTLFGARAGWLAAALAACNPFLTYYAQETRMYALVALLSMVVAATFGLVFVQRRRAWLPMLALALCALMYTHNWGLFLVAGAAAGVALLAARANGATRRALLRDGVLGFGAAVLAYLPWVPTLLEQARHTGAPWSERPPLDAIFDGLGNLMGGTGPAVALLIAGVAGAGAILGAERAPRRRDGPPAYAAPALLGIATMAGVALALAWLASQASPAWAARYFALFAGPLLLVVAAGLAHAGRLAVVVLVILAIFWIDPRTRQLETKSNAHTTAVLVRDRLEPGDLVVSTHPEHLPLMRLYLGPGLRWASSLGTPRDTRIMDWRNALDRLKAARPKPIADALVRSLRVGQHLLLVQPIIRSARWGAPWTELVRRRAMQWERRLDRDPRLSRTLAAPHLKGRAPPRGVRAVLYERRR